MSTRSAGAFSTAFYWSGASFDHRKSDRNEKQLSPSGRLLGVSAAPPAKRSRGPQWTTHGPSSLAPAIGLFTVFGYERDRDPNSALPPGGSP